MGSSRSLKKNLNKQIKSFILYCVEVHMHCRHTKSWLTGEAQMKRSLCTWQSVSLLSCFSICPYVPGIFWVPAVGCLLQVAKGVSLSCPFFRVIILRKLISWDQPDQFVLSCVWWKTTCSTIKRKEKCRFQLNNSASMLPASTSDWSPEPGSYVQDLFLHDDYCIRINILQWK